MVVLQDVDEVPEASAALLDLCRRNQDCEPSAQPCEACQSLTLRVLDAGDAHAGGRAQSTPGRVEQRVEGITWPLMASWRVLCSVVLRVVVVRIAPLDVGRTCLGGPHAG